MKTQIYLWLLCLLSALNIPVAYADTNVSGAISKDSVWTTAGSPYIVTGNLTVNSNAALQVQSGVIVKFNAGAKLTVLGTLNALNAEFTSNVSSPAKGNWAGIQLGNNVAATGTLTLNDCKIQYATNAVYVYSGTAAINGSNILASSNTAVYTDAGTTTISGSNISEAVSGVYANAGTIAISNSSISNCSTEGLTLNTSATVNLETTIITANTYPITFRGAGHLIYGQGNDLSGNSRLFAAIQFASLGSVWNIPSLPLPYVLPNSFTVTSAGEWTIASNNIIKSDGWIYVDGTLKAIAGENERIIFTSYKNDNAGGDSNNDGAATIPGRGSWGGVYFRNSGSNASVMQRCDVTFGGTSSRGAIVVENANPTIENCSLENNYYGFELRNAAKPVLRYNTIAGSAVVPVAMTFDSDPVFTDNVFSFSDNQYDAIGLLGSTLTANAHLIQRHVTTIQNVTYLMLGELVVPSGITLTIDPGIVIKATYYTHAIVVKGSLKANGAAGENQIIFTSVHDDTHGNPLDTNKNGTQTVPETGNWAGIIFENSSDDANCKLDYCRVKYAAMNSRSYSSHSLSGGAVTIINASPTIGNSVIQNSTYGIYAFQASNPVVQKVEISNTGSTPVALSVSANPSLNDISFVNAKWTALGIIGETVGVNGTVTKRNVAGYDNISYVLLGELTVNSGANITFSPGLVIKMNDNARILVDGGLKAAGAANDSIVFTSLHDDNFGNPGDTQSNGNATAPGKGNWRYIWFRATTDDAFSTVSYCKLMYGGATDGILCFSDANNTVSHTTISDSRYYGIWLNGSAAPDCTNNVVIQNCTSDPVALSLTSDPKFNITSPLFLGNGSNGLRILEETINVDATLIKRNVGGVENVAYIVHRFTMAPGALLTVNPGVIVKFDEYYTYNHAIIVNGAMRAIGTEAEPIVFTSISDDSKGGDTNGNGNQTTPFRGSWHAIEFNSSNLQEQNTLKNCIIAYGGFSDNANTSYSLYGAINIRSSKVIVDACRVEHARTAAIGIIGSSSPEIRNCEFNNTDIAPIAMSMFANPVFSNNTLFNVKGRLTVNGTENEPVVFADIDDDTYGNPKDTKSNGAVMPNINNRANYGITFQDISDDQSSINHALFACLNRGVELLQASPSIANSKFENSQWGVALKGVSQPAINNCAFNDLLYTPVLQSLVSEVITADNTETAGNSLSGSTYRAIGVLSEELVQDATLKRRTFAGVPNIPYYFSGNYTVGTSVTLSIEPGVICKFAPQTYLSVKRGLLAQGGASSQNKIVFTSIYDDFYGGDTNSNGKNTSGDGWRGLSFESVSLPNLCRLDNCILRRADCYIGGSLRYASAITTNTASPTITNSVVYDCYYGFTLNGASNPVINNCDIYNIADYAVNNINESFDIDAKNNWWGNNSGPAHASNPGGTGVKISDKVVYAPFKSAGSVAPVLGDVSLNGLIQAYDAALVLQHTVGSITLNDLQKPVADVSGDGAITAFDASRLS
jgi:parallel beta-helix repeat protein